MTKQYRTWKKRITAFVLVLALSLSMAPSPMSSAAKKVSLAKKKLTITVGKSKKLKLKNNKKKVSWKVVSGKKNIKLKAKKKTSVTIVAKKKGTAKVQAKVGKKKYTCKVTIVKKPTPTPKKTVTPGTQVSAAPDATADVTTNPGQSSQPDVPTYNPGSSEQPTQTPGSSEQPTQTPGSSEQPTQTPGSSEQPTQTPGSSEQPTQTPGSSSQPTQTPAPTGSPSTGSDTLTGKTIFTVAGKKLELGLSRTGVINQMGNPSREEPTPQGFTAMVYNPAKDGYTLIYLKDGVVVSICAVGTAGSVSYGNLVKTGDSASTLAGTSGWSGESWFAAKDGESKDGEGAYKYAASDPGATVLAYVDYYRNKGNTVYCIQAYSNTVSRDDMIYPANCSYNDAVLTAMKTQTAEFLIAYRIACGFSAATYPLKSVAGLATAAQNYLNTCPKGSDNPPNQQNSDALITEVLKQNGNDVPMHFAQITMAGSSDSIGFANSVLEQKAASDYIIKLSYTASASNGTAYRYWYQYLGIAAADDGNHHTYMVIDLVDRWNTSDKNWYEGSDDDEGWE